MSGELWELVEKELLQTQEGSKEKMESRSLGPSGQVQEPEAVDTRKERRPSGSSSVARG